MDNKRSYIIKNIVFCIFSAAMLILAFPKTDLWPLAWVGLVPLLFVLDNANRITAALYAYLTGFVFFLGVIYWFIHVTLPGMLIMVSVFALYFSLFGFFYSFFRNKKSIYRSFLVPSLWVMVEYLRGHLFTGFDWASLGHSQYKNLMVIQIADITGVAGISFLIVMVNVLVKECLVKKDKKTLMPQALVTGFLLLSTLAYGLWQLQKPRDAEGHLNVAVIQANIEQGMKWNGYFWPEIMDKYMALTREAAQEGPDLIIWPETSLPGILWEDKALLFELKGFIREKKIPVLIGAVVKEGDDYFNSALLFSEYGDVEEQYNKLHLVPFGEYIPFRGLFTFIEEILPIADFTAGDKFTVFRSNENKFAALICFEDTVARLSRRFVIEGAEALINITNDAWFKDTKAPYLHMQAALFRAVENRRPLVRAANTGVSCFIDPRGRIYHTLKDDRDKPTYVAGFAMERLSFSRETTFYTRFGDVFTYLCLGIILAGFAIKKD